MKVEFDIDLESFDLKINHTNNDEFSAEGYFRITGTDGYCSVVLNFSKQDNFHKSEKELHEFIKVRLIEYFINTRLLSKMVTADDISGLKI